MVRDSGVKMRFLEINAPPEGDGMLPMATEPGESY
jgi:hypothetical protein